MSESPGTMTDDSQAPQDWHVLSLPEILGNLGASEKGLDEGEAAARLERFGPNELPRKPPPGWGRIFLRQFRNPLIYILGVAALLSLATGRLGDAAFIAGVLCLNACIGAVQEWRAERSAAALQKLLRVRASVERDGEVREIDASRVVPGDILWLESGNRVPADVRLLDAHGLEIDESLLTGESLPVAKDPRATLEAATPVADRRNMAFAGSMIVRGRARGLTVGTATGTAVGQLALDVMGAKPSKPPLIVRMEHFTRAIGFAVVVAAIFLALLGIFVRGQEVTETVLFAIALVVAAIPEGLPVAMTIALAIAMTRMARRGVIVRRLSAVEGLGSCTLIATDKTGTLTANELTVREIRLPDGSVFEVGGEGFVPEGAVQRTCGPTGKPPAEALAAWGQVAALCNEADLHRRDGSWGWHGDPVDVAFLAAAHKLGLQRASQLETHPQENQIAFEPERQFAATYHRHGGDGAMVAVKGAPERVLGMCALSEEDRRKHILTAEQMAARGYRVLALARTELTAPVAPEDIPPEPRALTLLGFAGMIDPLRTGAREAVSQCLRSGVHVCMVTGDHRVTALAIARELGLGTDEAEVMTGSELEMASAEELKKAVRHVRVFARVAPHQKLRIVEAARSAGHFVAVTGDGVNDAPALSHAHIGVAMGRAGTDVAREAAELVISDDNFSTLVAGIRQGRIAYDNIRNVIYLLISTGAAEIVLVGLAVLLGTPLPLLPVQLLWLNLVTQGIQDVALAFEPGDPDILERPPRPPHQPIFNRLMIERTIVSAIVIGGIGFAVFRHILPADHTPAELAAAQNTLLLLMVLFENIHIGNCRSETRSALSRSPLRSPVLLLGVIGAFLAHLGAMYWAPMQRLLGVGPVVMQQWFWLIGLALSIFIAMELHKLSWWWRFGRDRKAERTS